MKNPKAWAGATSYDFKKVIDKSTTGRTEGNDSNTRGHAHPTRSWKVTPFTHNKPTPASEAIDAIPGATNTHPMLQVKESTASPSYGPGAKMIGAPKTGDKTMGSDAKERMPKKWTKRGYDMAGGHGVMTTSEINQANKKRRPNGLG